MSRQHLRTASELLEDAAARTEGDPAERLSGFVDRLDRMADASRDPDHGKLATVLLKLDEIAGDVDADVAETIQEAREHITAFRETVKGV